MSLMSILYEKSRKTPAKTAANPEKQHRGKRFGYKETGYTHRLFVQRRKC